MPRDSNGNWTNPYTQTAGTAARASAINNIASDLGTEVGDSLSRSAKGSMLAQLGVIAGSALTPSIAPSADPNTGIYSAGTDVLGVAAGGISAMTWSTSQVSTPLILKSTATSYSLLAKGTTAQRTSSAPDGSLRYNTTTATMEYSSSAVWRPITPSSFRGYISNCQIANGTDTINDIDFSAGVCRDSTNQYTMVMSAMTKQRDATWVAGSAAGGRSSAANADGTWHCFAIGKTDGTTDWFFHTAVDPTAVLPTGYTIFRRVASMPVEGSSFVQFTQDGDYFLRKTIKQTIVEGPVASTNAIDRTMAVPTGIRVRGEFMAQVVNTGVGAGILYTLLTDKDATDETPSSTLSDSVGVTGSNSIQSHMFTKFVRTNTSGIIRSRVSFTDGNCTIRIYDRGWFDTRNKDA
jgi:hypothetical protein